MIVVSSIYLNKKIQKGINYLSDLNMKKYRQTGIELSVDTMTKKIVVMQFNPNTANIGYIPPSPENFTPQMNNGMNYKNNNYVNMNNYGYMNQNTEQNWNNRNINNNLNNGWQGNQ
jgi:hypothetical protein